MVRSTTGWTIEIISGLEEARLIHLGILASGRMDARSVLLVDLAAAVRAHALARGTTPRYGEFAAWCGASDQRIPQARSARKSELKRLHEFVDREIMRVQARIKAARVGAVIATSGTAAALVGVASHLARPRKRRPATYVTAR